MSVMFDPESAVYPFPPKPARLSEDEKAFYREKIKALLKARNAVMVAHYYTDPEIQALIKKHSGASHVVVFDHTIRITDDESQRVSGARRFAAQSFSLARIKAAGKKHHATLNNAVMAMCASAVRQYLLDLDAWTKDATLDLQFRAALVPLGINNPDSTGGDGDVVDVGLRSGDPPIVEDSQAG